MQINTSISIPSFLALVLVLLLTAGCKIQITVPDGGKVVSASHAYDCDNGTTCVVEVNDFYFDETFDAHADEGWAFVGWKLSPGYLCGRSESVCHLSNQGLGQYEAIAAIIESDETFFLEPEFVMGIPYGEALANVQDERLRNCLWKVPPPRKYAEQVRHVDCKDYLYRSASVQGIEAFTRIERLGLMGTDSLTDLQPLSKLGRLRHLTLRLESNYFNAAALGELELLAYLDLSMEVNNPDLTEMGNLQSLRVLTLRAGRPDLNSISSLVNLRELTVSGEVYDIRPLAGMRNLAVLDISYNNIGWIGPLTGLKNLKVLNLSRNHISDISPLAGLTKLEHLDLSGRRGGGGNQISDIGPLAGLTILKDLGLNYNPISDIGPLAGMTKLETLRLGGVSLLGSNQISDIGPLARMTNLEVLDLGANNIGWIGPLAGLTKLEYLDLRDNHISDIGPLAEIESIPVLVLDNNVIRDVSPLKQHYPLTLGPDFEVRLGLSYNPIPSIGDALDGIRTGRVGLAGVPLSCQEYSQLAERYASRWILTDFYDSYGLLTEWFIDSSWNPSVAISLYQGYQPPRECR